MATNTSEGVILYPFWKKDRPNASQVWDHFGFKKDHLGELDRSMVYCKYCLKPKEYKHRGQTSNMISHLKAHHPEANIQSTRSFSIPSFDSSETLNIDTSESSVTLYPFWGKDKPNASNVWGYFGFKKNEEGELEKTRTYCKFCLKSLVYNKNTSNMRSHLYHHHPELESDNTETLNTKKRNYDALNDDESPSDDATYDFDLSIVKKEKVEDDISSNPLMLPDVAQMTTSYIKNKEANVIKPLAAIKELETVPLSKIVTHGKKKDISLIISNFLAEDMIAVNVLFGNGFKKMLSQLDPSYKIQDVKCYEEQIDNIYFTEVKRIKDMLHNISSATLTFDTWCDDTTNAQYISIGLQFITAYWELNNIALCTVKVSDIQDLTEEYLQQLLASWNLSETPILGICSANERLQSNLNALSIRYINCFGDIMNHVAIQALRISQASDSFNKVKGTFQNLSCNQIVEEYLSSYNHDNQENKPNNLNKKEANTILSFQDFTVTCWTDMYELVQKILKNEIAMKHLFNEYSLIDEPNALTQNDWAIINDVGTFCKLLNNVIESLCTEGNPSASSILPIVYQLKEVTETLDDDSQFLAELKKCSRNIIDKMSTYQEEHVKEILLMTTVLDPRFKRLWFLTSDEQYSVFKCLGKLASDLSDKQKEIQDKNKTIEPDEQIDSPKGLALLFHKMTKTKPLSGPEMEISQYREEEQLEMSENPLNWWKVKKDVYPTLSQLARKYLSMPACSLSPELIFTKAGEIFKNKRLAIPAKDIEKRLFLYFNLNAKY